MNFYRYFVLLSFRWLILFIAIPIILLLPTSYSIIFIYSSYLFPSDSSVWTVFLDFWELGVPVYCGFPVCLGDCRCYTIVFRLLFYCGVSVVYVYLYLLILLLLLLLLVSFSYLLPYSCLLPYPDIFFTNENDNS